MDAATEVEGKAIAETLNLEMLLASGSETFHIADLDCSIGPNTFSAVGNIIEAVKLKHDEQMQGMKKSLEFQVFFNDHTSNDFNMLFKSLPLNKEYCAACVPGSFHGRVFPKDSLHFVYSFATIHELYRVPNDVVDRNSPAWNKGKIEYSHSSNDVISAFEAQYTEDGVFLNARAHEIVYGGLMALVAGRQDGTPHSECSVNGNYHLLGSCLMEMTMTGVVSKEEADGFNLPMYFMSPQELKAVVELNGRFSIECVETSSDFSKLN